MKESVADVNNRDFLAAAVVLWSGSSQGTAFMVTPELLAGLMTGLQLP